MRTNSTIDPVVERNFQGIDIHLEILQKIIERMAANSSQCKTWCITVVSAVLVIVADKKDPNFAFIALFPSILFFGLDAYYLALEKAFRESYQSFVTDLHGDRLVYSDLYLVRSPESLKKLFFCAIKSPSVWPFYLAIIAMVFVVCSFIYFACPK